MMNFYVVLECEGFAPPIHFEDRTHAAEYCHQSGIPHFYEVSPANPMQPVKLWELVEGRNRKPYRLKSRRWLDVVQEHDGVMH